MTSERPPAKQLWALASQLTAVAWEFLASILAGALLGYVIDGYFGSAPWGLIACTLLGTTTGLYRMIVMLKHIERRSHG
ncbi:MAG: AtpZ/AtpI family protein [Candidatus Binatia bacterium]